MYIEIGHRSIPVIWIAILLACFLTALIYRIVRKTSIHSWYWNGFFIYLVTWKLSYILFNFKIFLKSPLSLLFFGGGSLGHIFAITVLCLYLVIVSKRETSTFSNNAPLEILLFFILYETCIQYFINGILAFLIQLFLLAGIIVYYAMSVNRNKQIPFQMYVVIILLEFCLISIFHPLFSTETITFTWIFILISILAKKEEVTNP